MAEAGALEDEYRYFGIDSPTGFRWYNFDPCSYLECGVRGSLGGNTVDGLTWDQFADLLWCGAVYE